MKIVNVNHKGGVGKTTNTIHIGAELHNRRHKVLLIDADNQCDLTAGVGVKSASYTIKDFLDEAPKNIEFSNIAENFHILAGDPEFTSEKYNRHRLWQMLEKYKVADQYDIILIDVPPTGVNPSFVTPAELSLCAVDFVIIPIQADMYSVKNIFGFIEKVLAMKKHNANLHLLGTYFTNVQVNTAVFKEYYELFKTENSNYFFETFVRKDAEVVNASLAGMTIFEYNDKCRASEDFKVLVTEILKKIDLWQRK